MTNNNGKKLLQGAPWTFGGETYEFHHIYGTITHEQAEALRNGEKITEPEND